MWSREQLVTRHTDGVKQPLRGGAACGGAPILPDRRVTGGLEPVSDEFRLGEEVRDECHVVSGNLPSADARADRGR